MNFWRQLLLIAGKELLHLRRDPYTLVLTVALPLVQFLLFGYALDTRVHDVPTAIQNLDGERFSHNLVAEFANSDVFRVTQRADSEAELLSLLRRGEARVAVQIPAHYSVDAFYHRPVSVRVWIDGSDAALAGQTVFAAQSIGLEQAVSMTLAGTPAARMPLQLRPEVLFNPAGRSANYFVPALVANLVEMTTLLLVALSLVKERERGTLDQLRITNIRLGALISGKLVAGAAMGLGTGFVLTVMMRLVFGIAVGGSLWLYSLALLAFLPPALGLGLFVTAVARNQAQALQLTYLLLMPCILLSGFVFPREAMPTAVAGFSMLIPTTWSLDIMRGIVLRGAGFADLAPSFGMLALLGVVYLSAGALHLRRRLL
jgi:ABC-2 type transport system permease protein